MSNFWKRLSPGLCARSRQGPDGASNRQDEPGKPSLVKHVPVVGRVDQRLLRCAPAAASTTPAGLEDLEQRLPEYIDGCYNPRWPHTALGNLSPFRFEAALPLSNGSESPKKQRGASREGASPLPARLCFINLTSVR